MSSAIWHGTPDLEHANHMSADSAIGHLGIEFTELGASHLIARMPVDSRTRQPFGILHGGASVLLAESLVSCAATFVAVPGTSCVGMEINANHLRPVTSGWVTGTARPISLGRRSQVWEVRIVDERRPARVHLPVHDGGDRGTLRRAGTAGHDVASESP